MATSANIAKLPVAAVSSKKDRFVAKERITEAVTPELVIALCGPLGTPLHRVSEILNDLLQRNHDYTRVEVIRLSQFIKEFGKPLNTKSIKDLIDAGNTLRKEHGNSVLAQLAIRKIATARELERRTPQDSNQLSLEGVPPEDGTVIPSPVVRHCHIIDSIKNTDELNLLRDLQNSRTQVNYLHAGVKNEGEHRLEGWKIRVSNHELGAHRWILP